MKVAKKKNKKFQLLLNLGQAKSII